MTLHCTTDLRRHAVRRFQGRNGLDYVEVGSDQRTLHVYMLGKLPPELAKDAPDLPRFFRIEGGEVVRGIRVLDADPVVDPDPEADDVIVLRLDRRGDFSTYTLRLVGVDDIDPHYESLRFSFKVDCPSDVDCRAATDCPPAATEEPALNYLAKDYASFRQLLMDRMALLIPDWTERHAPDLGVTLVELLAYVGDYLSYYQDAVGTEAYLETARQRVSVRRHARLVDYLLHEGCNARAWVHVRVSADAPALPAGKVAFVTGLDPSLGPASQPLASSRLIGTPASSYDWFEPLSTDVARPLAFKEAHNEIALYGWGRRNCCLEAGATRATLIDRWTGDAGDRALDLAAGDVLLFEEVKGARTGEDADADPGRRWVVRLTRVERGEDPVYTVPGCDGARATPLVEVEWAAADALPFPLCLSAVGQAPDCPAIDGVTVARGNMVLVDHGRTVRGEPLPPVPEEIVSACCDCAGQPAEVRRRAGRYRPKLHRPGIVHGARTVAEAAAGALAQDPRSAVPAIEVVEDGGESWRAAADLLGAGADDRLFVAEFDNDGFAQLRFGDGRLGRAPDVGVALTASYRIGGGSKGNVGPEAICRLVLADDLGIEGIDFAVRNPLAAAGGVDPEPLAQAKLHAPSAFLLNQRRAITAQDYAAAAMLDASLQRAAGKLVWTGAWWEAVVAVDPIGREGADPVRLADIERRLEPLRRIGHDLSVRSAAYVAIELAVSLCVSSGYDRGQVRRAVEARLVGPAGCFHPDRLSFGQGIYVSRIVADAMAVPGVECATVTRLNRRFQHPNGELEAGVLPLGPNEIAQLANDPNHPERGRLQLDVGGGR